MMGKNRQIITLLATLDALLVTKGRKRGQKFRVRLSFHPLPPISLLSDLVSTPPHFEIGRAVPVCSPLMVAGRKFHSFGAQIENALSPYVAVLLLGIARRF